MSRQFSECFYQRAHAQGWVRFLRRGGVGGGVWLRASNIATVTFFPRLTCRSTDFICGDAPAACRAIRKELQQKGWKSVGF